MKAENHDHMDHPTTSGAVPAMPAISADAKVVFSNLKDNATISSPFKLQMGTEVINDGGLILPQQGRLYQLLLPPFPFAV